jgi:hypothetical protein
MMQELVRRAEMSLDQAVERQIHHRTWGQIHHLRVAVQADCVVVQGSAPTYYAKQLVLSAVREVVPALPVRLDVQVVRSSPRPPQGPI